MEAVKFQNTDLVVSPLCLGTVNYGSTMERKASKEQLSAYVDHGYNFVDTAHVYGDWAASGEKSPSEKIIGEWFSETGNRSKVILSTKGAHPTWGKMDIPRVTPDCIREDLESSLRNLHTDYIDLYFLHRDDPTLPVSLIIDALEAHVKEGKIRYYGCSNWSLKRVKEAYEYAKTNGKTGFVCNQLMWSLADINFYGLEDKTFILLDHETREFTRESGMNVMAYMSVAKAYFQRRWNGETLPSSVADVYQNATNDRIYEIGSRFVAGNPGFTFMDLALLYIMTEKEFPSVPIASFDTPQQLETGLSCINKNLPSELRDVFETTKKYIYWGAE